MKPEPYFAPYPEAKPPRQARWWVSGGVLLALVGSGGVVLRPFIEARLSAALACVLLLAWGLMFLLRTLYYRLNRHNARTYTQEAEEVQRHWWARHRQQAALVDSVLLGALGSTPLHWRRVLARQASKPVSRNEPGGQAIRLIQVFEKDAADRENELARQLALQWGRQRKESDRLTPLRCYWQGSPASWSCFVQQMALECPEISLPELPERWVGLASLDAVIDLLQSASADERVLCAGAQSTSPRSKAMLPAGEAAVLWWLGRQGGVRLTRGEWYEAERDELVEVAGQALRQAGLDEPAEACVAFAQPGLSELGELSWNLPQQQQDSNWGELESLQAMVVQTLAAYYAEQHGSPCAWLAKDPEYTLAFGIVSPDEEPA